MMKNRPHFIQWTILLWCIGVAACGPAPAPVDSIARAAYYQDPALLEQAWQLPVARTYPNPIEYQINGAFCGPAAAVNLLRSLGVGRRDQESLFDKADVSRWKARFMGLTLDELAALIRANGAPDVTVLRDLSPEEFRAHLRRANDPAYRYLVNFDRQPLFGVSIGHHSPLGGYWADSDLVFVLDVLDEYQPFLAPAARLYEAMDTPDSETGKKRGLLLVRAVASPAAQNRAVRSK
ncbi:MAG: phytochelatin synthase family protein [Candidatus Competibacteraceae bacterium]